jgi:Zn-dependent alcohol dehydrogenase
MVYDVLDKHEKSAFKTSDERVARAYLSKNYNKLREAALDEGIQEWGKRLAMAGIIVAGLAGVNSINNAIDNSVPAVKAMNTALDMAQDSGNDDLAKMIEKDLSDAKIRLSSGKDLAHVKDLQDKYAKFIQTEGLAYESQLQIKLSKRI